MHNILFSQCSEGQANLLKQLQRVPLIDMSAFVDDCLKRSPVTEFVDKLLVVGRSEHLNKLDDVGVVDARERLNFVHCELLELRDLRKLILLHAFDGHQLAAVHVRCLLDLAVLAGAHHLN